MTRELLDHDLKRIEKKLRDNGDTDSLVVAEARCEIKNLEAKYNLIHENLLKVLRGEQI